MTNPQPPPIPTPADFNALTWTQRSCLAYYAVGAAMGARTIWDPRTHGSLFRRGVLERTLNRLVRQGMLERVDYPMDGGLTIQDYAMPIAAHIAWCEWCSETLDEEAEETLEVAEFAEWYKHESPIDEETSDEH